MRVGLAVRDLAAFRALAPARRLELAALRALLGEAARPLGFCAGADFGFLAAETAGARRSLVWLEPDVLLACDLSAECWSLTGPIRAVSLTTLQPAAGHVWRRATDDALEICSRDTDSVFLNILQFGAAREVVPIDTLDLVGARIGAHAVLFHNEPRMARSMLHFDTGGGGALQYLVTGLAPGTWEIWRNGFLEDPQGAVEPSAGALRFSGPPGSYFLRHL